MSTAYEQASIAGISMSLQFVDPVNSSAIDTLLHVDKNKIRQVICNLLSNALKFTAACDSSDKSVIVEMSYLFNSSMGSPLYQTRGCGTADLCQ
jgi:signal transduction histidine kinase